MAAVAPKHSGDRWGQYFGTYSEGKGNVEARLERSGRAAVESPKTDLRRHDYTGPEETMDSSPVLRLEHRLDHPRGVRNLAKDSAQLWEVDAGRDVMVRESGGVVEGKSTAVDHAEKDIPRLIEFRYSPPFLLDRLAVESADCGLLEAAVGKWVRLSRSTARGLRVYSLIL